MRDDYRDRLERTGTGRCRRECHRSVRRHKGVAADREQQCERDVASRWPGARFVCHARASIRDVRVDRPDAGAAQSASSGPRRERLIAMSIAAALVLARSFVFLRYESSFFDSDQAIVGLMAKHLEEGRAFPLFFYGQSYLLAVEAWLAAPLFWVAGASVATLRASLVLTNLAVAMLLIAGLERWGGLRPLLGLAAIVFFAFAPPYTAALLVQANGANIEPFLFVLLLWIVRRRPLWFGAILAVGFLTREFTIYAVPVILAGQLWDRSLFRSDAVQHWLLIAVVFFAVWQGVHALRPFADLMGPGTRGQLLRGFAASQFDNLSNRASFVAAEIPSRSAAMLLHDLPRLLGASVVEETVARQGHDWMFWPLVAGLTAAMLRTGFVLTWGRGPRVHLSAFGWYVLGVGVASAVGYVASRPVSAVIDRYFLLGLFIPAGIVAIFLAHEPDRWPRRAMLSLVLIWTLASGVDHVRLLQRVRGTAAPDPSRALADALVARGVHTAEAGYWRAYKLTFLSGERVKIASNDFIRIDEYQNLAAAEGDRLIGIREEPCPRGEKIAGWYLCQPPP